MALGLIYCFDIFNKPPNCLICDAAENKALLWESIEDIVGAGVGGWTTAFARAEILNKDLIPLPVCQRHYCTLWSCARRFTQNFSLHSKTWEGHFPRPSRRLLALDIRTQGRGWPVRAAVIHTRCLSGVSKFSTQPEPGVWGKDGVDSCDVARLWCRQSYKEEAAGAKAKAHYGFLHLLPWRRAKHPIGGRALNATAAMVLKQLASCFLAFFMHIIILSLLLSKLPTCRFARTQSNDLTWSFCFEVKERKWFLLVGSEVSHARPLRPARFFLYSAARAAAAPIASGMKTLGPYSGHWVRYKFLLKIREMICTHISAKAP